MAMIGRFDSAVVRIARHFVVTLLKGGVMHRRCLNHGGGSKQKREGGGRELHGK